jgi:SecD/SecF fusion protein
MEKQKRWQFWIIVTVLTWTLINIFPTIFYYSKPLKEAIHEKQALTIGHEALDRVQSLEEEAISWVTSYAKQLGVQLKKVSFDQENKATLIAEFNSAKEADLFRKYGTKAGSLIGFAPAKLSILSFSADPKTVVIERQVNTSIPSQDIKNYLGFIEKTDAQGKMTDAYHSLLNERLSHLIKIAAGSSQEASLVQAALFSETNKKELTFLAAERLYDISKNYGVDRPLTERLFTLSMQGSQGNLYNAFKKTATNFLNELKLEDKTKESLGKITLLESVLSLLEKNKEIFTKTIPALSQEQIQALVTASQEKINPKDPRQVAHLLDHNAFIEAIVVNFAHDEITLSLYKDVENSAKSSPAINQALISSVARLSNISGEKFILGNNSYALNLFSLNSPTSFLTLSLDKLALDAASSLKKEIEAIWQPKSADLARENYPLYPFSEREKLSGLDKELGLFITAPLTEATSLPDVFEKDSIYIIGKGLLPLVEKAQKEGSILEKDLRELFTFFQSKGFLIYRADTFGLGKEFSQDIIFQWKDFYANFLAATRENFAVHGAIAVLPFTNLEQRIATNNQIGDAIQNDLIKWQEDYSLAQVDINKERALELAPPTKNVYLENIKLSLSKYFHGDETRVLKWGLDLSGGKTVRIGLLDASGAPVTDQADLNQAVNELYTRINKMGVAERTIRVENDHIVLDFPGSQTLSAEELIKASAMYFHIVNEEFSGVNAPLKDNVQRFLQSVWNEASITNKTDTNSINQIAWKRLGGDPSSEETLEPQDTISKALYEGGLRLANPNNARKSDTFDTTISSIAKHKGEDYKEWGGNTNPLVIVFHNYALEGANLSNVQVNYDPMQGNILSFGVSSSYQGIAKEGSPRDAFYAWTKAFSEENIAGNKIADYTHSRGYRMAAILNEEIISMPALHAAIRDGGMISGRFTQKEIAELASDLKAGSLTFTPKILSEQNISPELGKEERNKSLFASFIGLSLVAVAMIGYYRFGGFIATCAVFLNLFIMWGILQNIGAALTLPGIAGIVLTIGMAVDANVLIFERIREEFKLTGNIALAIHAGYDKAFSAIVDSNVTTILAAIILTQFDSGPIKGFAVTLIIGITSSMFTALFLTRYFFAGWVQKKENTSLHLVELLNNKNFPFYSKRYIATGISLAIVIFGGAALYEQRDTLLGMDFKGGYSLQIEVEESNNGSPRLLVAQALEKKGVSSKEIEIQELGKNNLLRIQLASSIDEKGHAFYNLIDKEDSLAIASYNYEKLPRLNWVVETLKADGIEIKGSTLKNLDQQFTMMSGRFSEVMKKNAMIALGCALLAILAYITVRFEFIYAISAVIALAHDVFVTLAIIGILRVLGVAVQMDLEVVGALMTIIGYSLNDTIIVFDRIREDLPLMEKIPFKKVIDHALNATLGRTLMTSITTILVLLPLVFFGGSSIFAFSLVMTIGVIVGTLSTLFIACPLLHFFYTKQKHAQNQHTAIKSI